MAEQLTELHELPSTVQMEPTIQLTIYERTNRSYDDNSFYIEYNQVHKRKVSGKKTGTEFVPDQPQPLQKTHLAHLGSQLIQYMIVTPPYLGRERVLFYQPHPAGIKVAFWTEAGDRYVNFGGSMSSLGSGTVHMPRTLFVVRGSVLDVFCLPTGQPVTASTPILINPFPNTNNAGGVCLGSGQVPDPSKVPSVDELVRQWEQLFFYSEFSHFGGRGEGSAMAKGSLGDVWTRQMREKSLFPEHLLLPDKKGRTVGHILQALQS